MPARVGIPTLALLTLSDSKETKSMNDKEKLEAIHKEMDRLKDDADVWELETLDDCVTRVKEILDQGPAEQVTILSTDNRDFRTTWLWIDNKRYVEVDPLDLLKNAIENCDEQEQAPLWDAYNKLENA
jgi:chemotaxis protein histidine kinase CheA